MNNRKLTICAIVASVIIFMDLFITPANAQVKEILVGHTMPDVAINEIVNYKAPTARLSDFKGKLLILDFWGTYCSPCVSMFPKSDSLEKLFGGRLQFLPVTKEPKGKVVAFMENMYRVRHLRPISAVNDTVLSKLFYYASVPYYVWIDGSGKMVATTGPEEITEQNIRAILDGKPPTFVNRNDIRKRKIDIQKSLFQISDNFIGKDVSEKPEEVVTDHIVSYSIATKFIENATNGQLVFDMNHFAAFNTSIDFLYHFYYDAGYYPAPVRGAFTPKSKHVFEIKDSKLLDRITDPDEENKSSQAILDWARKNAVCYEIVYPPNLTWKEKMDLVRKDLERYFEKPMGFSARVEKRIDSNTYYLRRIDDHTPLATKGGDAEEHHDRYSYHQRNMPLSKLISLMNDYFFQNSNKSFIDKTGFGAVDLQINCDMGDITSINEALSKFGLRFFVEPSKIDVLVFTDAEH